MSALQRFTKVWIQLVKKNQDGSIVPVAVAPGIVVDPTIRTRTVQRSQLKGGDFELNRAVEVISFRNAPNRGPFYTKRAEAVISLSPRKEHLPVIDGPQDADPEVLLQTLEAAAAESLARLAAPPDAGLVADATREYGNAPALTL